MMYAQKIRRQLHMYPEVGFDLDRTLQLLREELDKLGISYTEAYGKSSIVATINPEKQHFTIGVRADMDALPIQEIGTSEYKSRIKGQMHACGHDAHAAIALATAKYIHEIRAPFSPIPRHFRQPGVPVADRIADLLDLFPALVLLLAGLDVLRPTGACHSATG